MFELFTALFEMICAHGGHEPVIIIVD